MGGLKTRRKLEKGSEEEEEDEEEGWKTCKGKGRSRNRLL